MARDQAELLEMGIRIKELRESHGFKQQWIADQIGVELRTYQFWQQGKSPPEQENLEKLAALFGVTPRYILRGEVSGPLPTHPQTLEQLAGTLAGIEEQVRLLRAQLTVHDAEVKKRIDEGFGPTRASRPRRLR